MRKLYRKLYTILFLLIMILSCTQNVYAGEYVTFTTEKNSSTVTISFDVHEHAIYGMHTTIGYDADKLSLISCTSSNYTVSTNVNNGVIIVAESINPLSNRNIVKCSFNILNTEASLRLTTIDISTKEENLEQIEVNREIQLSDISYVPNTIFNHAGITVLGMIILGIGLYMINKEKSSLINVIGVLLLVLIPIKVFAEDDFTLDDLTRVRNILLQKETYTTSDFRLDVDEDEKISINDLILIKIKTYIPDIIFDTTTKGSGEYYESVTTKIKLENSTAVASVMYCFTKEDSCTPDQIANYGNDVVLKYPDNQSSQKLCVSITYDTGQTVSKCDTKKYKVDSSGLYGLTPMGSYKETVQPTTEKQTLRVLVIEINPILTSITDSKYGNDGHPKVSEFFEQDQEQILNEAIKDLKETSHDYLDIKIQREYLNEFPRYQGTVNLLNGDTAHSFDEETYLHYAGYESGSNGVWHNLYENDIFSEVEEYSFDYDYIINKYNLIEKRNNNVFDQVWLLSIDPSSTFETIMVGNNAYWINGTPKEAECQNFMIANFSISRGDSNFHALGHGLEGIMSDIFSENKTYREDYYYVNSVDDYNRKDLWTKFTLGIYSNMGPYAGVGNVHFPFNGNSDYDYNNPTNVLSNWQEWENYPNIEGNFVESNKDAWMNHPINQNLSATENKDPDRLYMRFWFNLLPHHTGYTEDGYSNNWWTYFYSLDKVSNLTCISDISVPVGYAMTDYTAVEHYASGRRMDKILTKYQANIKVDNKDLFGVNSEGVMIPMSTGFTQITYYRDGKSCTTNVTIE